MFDFIKKFDGLKVHLVVVTFLASVALEKGLGLDVPGFEVGDDWVNDVYMALGVSGFRDALRKYGGMIFGGKAS